MPRVFNTNDSTVGTVGSGLSSYLGRSLAPNGSIYAIPWGATSVLKITPQANTNFDQELLLSPFFNLH